MSGSGFFNKKEKKEIAKILSFKNNKNIIVLKFFKGRKGNIIGKYFDGRICLINRLYNGEQPKENEHWICKIVMEKPNCIIVEPINKIERTYNITEYNCEHIAITTYNIPDENCLTIDSVITIGKINRICGYCKYKKELDHFLSIKDEFFNTVKECMKIVNNIIPKEKLIDKVKDIPSEEFKKEFERVKNIIKTIMYTVEDVLNRNLTIENIISKIQKEETRNALESIFFDINTIKKGMIVFLDYRRLYTVKSRKPIEIENLEIIYPIRHRKVYKSGIHNPPAQPVPWNGFIDEDYDEDYTLEPYKIDEGICEIKEISYNGKKVIVKLEYIEDLNDFYHEILNKLCKIEDQQEIVTFLLLLLITEKLEDLNPREIEFIEKYIKQKYLGKTEKTKLYLFDKFLLNKIKEIDTEFPESLIKYIPINKPKEFDYELQKLWYEVNEDILKEFKEKLVKLESLDKELFENLITIIDPYASEFGSLLSSEKLWDCYITFKNISEEELKEYLDTKENSIREWLEYAKKETYEKKEIFE